MQWLEHLRDVLQMIERDQDGVKGLESPDETINPDVVPKDVSACHQRKKGHPLNVGWSRMQNDNFEWVWILII